EDSGMITQQPRLLGELIIPGDKSITHRAFIFSALCNGTSSISGISPAKDCESTLECLQQLGVHIEKKPTSITISAGGLSGLQKPKSTLDVGNSGTTIRILAGLLAGRDFTSVLDGDSSIRRRPMRRVVEPVTLMGTKVAFLGEKDCAPFKIEGTKLHAINYSCPVASAQVQTAVVLAALQAEGITTVELPSAVRDHTVRMFQHLGLAAASEPSGSKSSNALQCIFLDNPQTLRIKKLEHQIPPFTLSVPGDISSATFFMVAAALLPGSSLR